MELTEFKRHCIVDNLPECNNVYREKPIPIKFNYQNKNCTWCKKTITERTFPCPFIADIVIYPCQVVRCRLCGYDVSVYYVAKMVVCM